MAGKQIQYDRKGHVGVITMDRPPVNALSLSFIQDLVAAMKTAASDDGARAVIISSAIARRFSAGLDIDILLGKPVEEIRPFLETLYIDLYDAQYNLGKPSIAAINGAARGGGVTIAISCDVLIAEQSASFGYPEIDIGVLPAIHFTYLPRIVGRHRAFELLFSGRNYGASEAERLGIVSKVVADGGAEAAAMELAETFASKSPDIMRRARNAFMRQNDMDYRRGISVAVEDFCSIVTSEATQEGLRAFVEKRQPNWKQSD